jgi:putative DNA methylase
MIESTLPVYKLSVESYKEQKAVHGKTLTAMGSYWKGRKPLILNRAVILASLLPATADTESDLELLETLLGMDPIGLRRRLGLADESPLPEGDYLSLVRRAARPEELGSKLLNGRWAGINRRLATSAESIPELVEQLGIMRFGHAPRFREPFAGSGQIAYEAARMGCSVEASDISPVAALLTWGALHVAANGTAGRDRWRESRARLFAALDSTIEAHGMEPKRDDWMPKVYLYCSEVLDQQTGWRIPLLTSRVVSHGYRTIARLVPISAARCFFIQLQRDASDEELRDARPGTVRRKSGKLYAVYTIDGKEFECAIPSGGQLRLWSASDVGPRPDDLIGERLYAIEWMRPRGRSFDYEFREPTDEDLSIEDALRAHAAATIHDWMKSGWVPSNPFPIGPKTAEPRRARGWTHWHHFLNPRQLMMAAAARPSVDECGALLFAQLLNWNSRLSTWNRSGGGGGIVQQAFLEQALNPLHDYGCRASRYLTPLLELEPKDWAREAAPHRASASIRCTPASHPAGEYDLLVTDPPYADAVRYDELLRYFSAWFEERPPAEFRDWNWSIGGQSGQDFESMLSASWQSLTPLMAERGLQVIMFAHKRPEIWAQLGRALIQAGVCVSACWCVTTETAPFLKPGNFAKGSILLVLRRRSPSSPATWRSLDEELSSAISQQLARLMAALPESGRATRQSTLFESADLAMVVNAAAISVVSRHDSLDGEPTTSHKLLLRVLRHAATLARSLQP